VTEISAANKAAITTRGVARVVVRSRWGRAFGAVASSLIRVGHVLWLEVTGFFFAVFTVIGGAAMIREVQVHAAAGRIAVLAVFTLMFAWFAFTSFARARKRKNR
jgi:NADH:ubiquinone oxidoreductase subunit 6 (subunit J)